MVCILLYFHLVTSITRRRDVIALCCVIQSGAFHSLITLDLQCTFFPLLSPADCRFTDPNIRLLCNALCTGNCPCLQILRLSNNAVGVAGSTALAACLAHNALPSLRFLDMQRVF